MRERRFVPNNPRFFPGTLELYGVMVLCAARCLAESLYPCGFPDLISLSVPVFPVFRGGGPPFTEIGKKLQGIFSQKRLTYTYILKNPGTKERSQTPYPCGSSKNLWITIF